MVLGSGDGKLWTLHEVPVPGGLQCVTHGTGMFVATQSLPQPQVWTSADGVDWRQTGAIPARNIVRLIYGNGVFLACGSDGGSCSGPGHGVLFASVDAVSWLPVLDWDCLVRDVAYGAGSFVSISNYGGRGGVYGTISSSDDGINWQRRISYRNLELSAVTFASARFLVVGRGANVFQSGPVLTPVQRPELQVQRLPGGLARLVAQSPAGVLWIESSGDLGNWQPFATVGIGTAGVPNWLEFDLSGTGKTLQFYRARLSQ